MRGDWVVGRSGAVAGRWLRMSSQWMLTAGSRRQTWAERAPLCLFTADRRPAVLRVDNVWSAGKSGYSKLHRKQSHAFGESVDADCEDICWCRLQSAKPVWIWRLAHCRQSTSYGRPLAYCVHSGVIITQAATVVAVIIFIFLSYKKYKAYIF